LVGSPSYFALRTQASPSGDDWWAAARRRHDRPPAVGAMLAGRDRVEVTELEAQQALDWAGGVDGWGSASPKPFFMYSGDPAVRV
jgi:hypothetical protein